MIKEGSGLHAKRLGTGFHFLDIISRYDELELANPPLPVPPSWQFGAWISGAVHWRWHWPSKQLAGRL